MGERQDRRRDDDAARDAERRAVRAQGAAADEVDALARQAEHDAAEGMYVSSRELRRLRDEVVAGLHGEGSRWLPPGARPLRPAGELHEALHRAPRERWWWRRATGDGG